MPPSHRQPSGTRRGRLPLGLLSGRPRPGRRAAGSAGDAPAGLAAGAYENPPTPAAAYGDPAASPARRASAAVSSRISPQMRQVIRFALVGVVNTGTFYACYLALHPWLPYFLAYTVAFVLSMIGSFFLNTYFTYRTRPTWRKFLLFPLTNLTNYVVTSVGVYVLVEWARMDNRIAPLVAATAAIPFTFVLTRHILTRTGRSPETPAPPRPAQPADRVGA